jgi:hypothetical protein
MPAKVNILGLTIHLQVSKIITSVNSNFVSNLQDLERFHVNSFSNIISAHHQASKPTNTDFCTCSLFSASFHTTDFFPSMTSDVTS